MKGHVCLLGDASHVHLRRWAEAMRARGWRVSTVSALPLSQPGIEALALPPVRRSVDWLGRVGAARRAVAALQPDLVHAHYVTSYGYLAARAAGVRPLVMTAWGSDLLVTPAESPFKRWLTAWTLRQADAITGDSADLVEAARALLGRRARAELMELHWGVELSRFRPVAWADKPGFELVSLRSWSANYRVDLILRAVARLPGVVLHLLGGGPDEAALRQLAHSLGLGERAVFHGRLDDAPRRISTPLGPAQLRQTTTQFAARAEGEVV